MKLRGFALGAFILLVLAGLAILAVWSRLESSMVGGLASGFVLGLGLTLLGGISLKRAMNHKPRFALMAHVYTGLAMRIGVLCAGAFLLMATGWASPVGFAAGFLGGVLVALARQVAVYAVPDASMSQ